MQDIFPTHKPLLTPPAGNTKLRRSQTDTHSAWSLALFPGSKKICSHASRACLRACVSSTGLSKVFPAIDESRKLKTEMFLQQKERFIARLEHEIRGILLEFASSGMHPLFRLNAFSEIRWERIAPQLFDLPGIQVYDYAANPARIGDTPPNYRLTFSRKEDNEPEVLRQLARGQNCAVVFHEVGSYAGHGAYAQRLPPIWRGYSVIDGDISDFRSLDPLAPQGAKGYVIGLRLKGSPEQRKDAIDSGFSLLSFP
jgi:hypothetical protein